MTIGLALGFARGYLAARRDGVGARRFALRAVFLFLDGGFCLTSKACAGSRIAR
jgi:hypothetical protein